jgi:prepilin-type N-terminal cleavage/methylation domain-containing protein
MNAGSKLATRHGNQGGFTLVEMLIATVILLVGLVAVAQFVPVSVMMNSHNRNDGTALVFAQHELETIREQSLSVPLTPLPTFADPMGVTCPIGNTCNLGDPTLPNKIVGSPVVIGAAGSPIIDFSATPVTGYSLQYTDPNDPYGAPYDVRWTIISFTNPKTKIITGRRIIVGVFRPGMQTRTLPISLDTMVEK